MMRRIAFLAVVLGCATLLMVCAEEPKAKKGPRPQYERMLQGDDAKKAAELQNKIAGLEAAGKRDEMLKAAEGLLDLRRTIQGDDHWETIDAGVAVTGLRQPRTPEQVKALAEAGRLNAQVISLYQQGKTTEAVPLAQTMVKIRSRVQGEKHPDTASSLNNLALLYQSQGKYAQAEPLFRDALKIDREVLGEKHPHTALSLNNLAELLWSQGKYAEAEPLYRDALKINREVQGEKHPHTAGGLNNLAELLRSQGKYAEAEPLFRDALKIKREVLGEKHSSTAATLSALALLYRSQGKYTEAEPLFRDALKIYREVLGEKHPHTAVSLNNLAGLYYVQGRYAEAEPLYRDALKIRREVLGEKHPNTADSLSGLGTMYYSQGKYAEAEALYRDAVKIYREALGEKHPFTAASLTNLALLYQSQGKYAEAEPLYRDALKIRREVLGEKHSDTAHTLSWLALLYQSQGRYAEAEPLCCEAVKIYREALGEKHRDTAASVNSLAFLYQSEGKFAEAEPLFRDALKIRREVLGEKHPDTANSLNNLAGVFMCQGKYAEAEPLLLACVRTFEASRLVRAAALERSIDNSGLNPYPPLAAVCARLHKPTKAFHAVEFNLARGLLDEQSARRGALATPDERKRQDEITGRLAAVEMRIRKLASQHQRSSMELKELDDLVVERRGLDDRLAELGAALSRREVAEPTIIQQALPADAAFVAWVDVYMTIGNGNEHWACVLRSEGEPHWVNLAGNRPDGKWAPEDKQVAGRLRTALAGAALRPSIGDSAKELYAQRLAPLEEHLQGVKRLYVAGVNDMAGVPVDLLSDKYTISYVPSGTFLARLKDRPAPTSSGLLALGDPIFRPTQAKPEQPLPPGGLLITFVAPGGNADKGRLASGDVLLKYAGVDVNSIETLGKLIQEKAGAGAIELIVWRDGKTNVRDVPPGPLGIVLAKDLAPQALADRRKMDALLAQRSGDNLTELPGTRVELNNLAQMFAKESTILADSDASEQKLEELRQNGDLARYRYLHFGSHGAANNVKAFESVLYLAQDKLPKESLPEPGKPFINGELTAREVLEFWKLDAELVTLSACETALGKAGGGDGLLGFAQAFLTAGARSVCLSLWKVDDAATALLMDRFYKNLLGKREGLTQALPKAEALAEAKTWLRNLSYDEVAEQTAALTQGVARGKDQPALKIVTPEKPKGEAGAGAKPFAHPRYWAAFILIGDSN
jgi:tetratricopeptide (TPR) repeat protein